MLRKKTTKSKTVSDKITELITRNASSDDESSNGQTEDPRVEEHFDEYDLPDARSSDIRKRNVKFLSEQSVRYRGKLSTRNELEKEYESDSSENEDQDEPQEKDYSSSNDDDVGPLKAFTKQLSGAGSKGGTTDYVADKSGHSDLNEDSNADEYDSTEQGEEEGTEEDDDAEESESEEDGSDEQLANGTDIIAETNRQAEVQKGQCVQNQLQIWERLLEMRIQTQKILSKSMQIPTPDELKTQKDQNEKLTNVSVESVNRVSKMLSTLLQLQNAFCKQFSEQRNALKKSLKRPLPTHDTDKDTPIPIKRFAEHIDTHFQEFKPYRNAVLLKWDDRTRLLTPGAGAKKKSLTEDYDIIRKIENILQNRRALIEKSQLLRNGEYEIAEKDAAENGPENSQKLTRNAELYDDSDFYHQQLRELIEYKTNISVSASEVTQQYVELQKLRQKMKKKVDTRASKGRKLRYTVHNKLINFMAPDDTSTWTEESKEELYRSLFAS